MLEHSLVQRGLRVGWRPSAIELEFKVRPSIEGSCHRIQILIRV